MSNEGNNKAPKKMNFLDGFMMCSGVIIGSGIFSMTGIGVRAAGPAVPLAFLLGGVYAVFSSLPLVVISSGIPIKGGTYRYTSEFISPLAGFLVFWNSILGIATLTIMGLAAGQYLPLLLPFLSPKVSALIVVFLTSIACFYNITISATVQNVMVGLIFVALALFVGMGLPNIKYWTFSDMFRPNGGIGGLILAVNYLRYAAAGGTTLVPMASEVKNPGFTVPATALASTVAITFVYGLVAAVAVGVLPWEEMVDQPLGVAAAVFMPQWALTFFLVGGALFAVTTTFLGSLLMTSRTFWAAAEDGLLPDWFKKQNKHGVPSNILALLTVVSAIPILLGADISYAYAIQSAPAAIFMLLTLTPSMIAPRRLPEKFANAWFRLPKTVNDIIVLANCAVALYLGFQLFGTLDMGTIIGVVVFFGAGIVYYYWWKGRLAAKGVILEEQMRIDYDAQFD